MPTESFDDLLRRDEQREKDGFEKKIKIRRILAGKGKVIVVPHVVEEKLIHGEFEPNGEHGQDEAGHGNGEVGDVIYESPLIGNEDGDDFDDDGDDTDDGQAGEGGIEHGIETEAYELGKELSTKLELPNLKDKGKKVPTDDYVYDLTDRHKGSGQLLDKKATLRSIVKTNFALGRIDKDNIDMSKLIVGPQDKIYRVLSKERAWKSQAIVFFLRDYSISMYGEPTGIIISQHLMIYSWLLFQYEKLVIPRFIVHDTEAKEVTVDGYFRAKAGGGTFIPSGYKLINEIVNNEGLARDYNIYVFQGTDGDDMDDGKNAIPEIEEILSYVNRMGVTVLNNSRIIDADANSQFEEYIANSDLIDKTDVFRMHIMPGSGVSDEDNEEAIKALVAQD
jgi:uncharacterized protein